MLFDNDPESAERYPYMRLYTNYMKKMTRPLVGREHEKQLVMAAMLKPELCNVLLLAEAGTGKTALVQGIMVEDRDRIYLEVDLPKMLTNLRDTNEMADRLKTLFGEVSAFREERKQDIVLFIDEFHQIVQLSPAAVEVLKPMLADSGTRGIRFIAATTQIEYQQFIAPNLPLVERLQRIRLVQPGEDVVVSILQSMCDRYGVQPANDTLFTDIYTYTNRYIPATSQPRKSILILDTMIGWHRLTKRPLDRKLLADVIYETEGINVAFRVDAASIKRRLDEKVIAQQVATSSIEQRMQICVAGLNNPNRPMSSFLFAGSTGVGKGLWDEELIPVWTPDGSVSLKRNGDLEIGDYVFNRRGEPRMVVGVFHRGLKKAYRVTLGDGRTAIVDGSHLWAWKYAKGHDSERYVVSNTEDLLAQGLYRQERNGRQSAKFWIPMNEAAQYPEREYRCPPYVLGALIGNGCLTMPNGLVLSSGNSFVPDKVARLIGAKGAKQYRRNYDWSFVTEYGKDKSHDSLVQIDDVLREVPELIGLKSHEKFIPDMYKYGSVEQRWELIRGLFDTDGSIGQFDSDRFNVSYSTTSERLARDLQSVLFSLGVASTVNNHGDRERGGDVHDEYHVHVKIENDRKEMFFTLPKKRDIAIRAKGVAKQRQKLFDCVSIASIEALPDTMPTTCIMVDDDEHLYQGPNHLVSHNTEATKQLAAILYDDDRNLIRFDMTEFALPDSLNRFRRELTNRVAAIPYCLILLDEIEKACAPVTRVLLQVLDDGRLMDENEREVTFKNAYIIVTTNSGSEIFKTISNYESSDKADFKVLEKYDKLLRESIRSQSGSKFPPELLGRIDCIVPFQPLSKRTMMAIIQMKLRSLAKTVKQKHGIDLHIHKNIYIYLVFDKLDTDADSGGARIVVSKMERELTVPLARYINEHPEEKEVYVSIGGNMAIMDKRQLESEAYVYVGPKFVNNTADLAEKLKNQQ